MSEKRTVQTILVAAESVVLSTSDFDWLYQAVQHNDQLTKELSLAEEGLANATQEIAHLHSRLAYRLHELDMRNQELKQLRALLTQAPIAQVTVREGCMANAPDDVYVKLYAPGLPYGEHDLFLMPSVPPTCPDCGVQYVPGARHFSGCKSHPGEPVPQSEPRT